MGRTVVSERARQGHQAALDGGRRAGQFIDEKTPPIVKQRLGEFADAADRYAQAIEDATPPAVKEKLAQAGAAIDKIPQPVKHGMAGAAAAAILAPIAAPAILGGIYGIAAAGPVAGGVFAGIQAGGGAIAAGSSLAVVQSIAMGGALPLIGAISAGGIGGVVGGGGSWIARRVRGRQSEGGEGDDGSGNDDDPEEKRFSVPDDTDTNSKLPRDLALKFLRDEEFVEKSTLDDTAIITCTACNTTVWTETEKDEGDLEPGLGAWIYHEERCDHIHARAHL
ncbi:hypothetical protein CYLTODRAFT_457275 [Cylindrobasidium torrendii FP15055 ss-10]|uniref:Uncharacterized protein n=1 Tax=Cylindrobasidium torrendii FP15055 ss-10 TaxID=1314674 RepID=A0A0D7B149_9AGAR|nr:hypothetical protein CYLTODRAFT_457275 [Cylindrobasidium torrendii FP15055 ss-10]